MTTHMARKRKGESSFKGNKKQHSMRTRRKGDNRIGKEDEKNKKRYNLMKRIGRTVYVSASKIFD
jgi:hypothetical protein